VQKVEKRVQPLADLRELIMSDSIESFELNYTTLLQNHPDCPVSLPPSKPTFDQELIAYNSLQGPVQPRLFYCNLESQLLRSVLGRWTCNLQGRIHALGKYLEKQGCRETSRTGQGRS
jgi:hypothetical protein